MSGRLFDRPHTPKPETLQVEAWLPDEMWLAIFDNVPLKEMKALRAAGRLSNILVEDIVERTFLKPPHERKTILSAMAASQTYQIVNDLINGSALTTFMIIPAARDDQWVNIDRKGRLYSAEKRLNALNDDANAHELISMLDNPDADETISLIHQISGGFMTIDLHVTILDRNSAALGVAGTLTDHQQSYLHTPLTISKIYRGDLSLQEAIDSCKPEALAKLFEDPNDKFIIKCLQMGLSPADITDIQRTKSDEFKSQLFNMSEINLLYLYLFSNINYSKLSGLDEASISKLFFDYIPVIINLMNTPCNANLKDVSELLPEQLLLILENVNHLPKILQLGASITDLAKLSGDELKLLNQKMDKMLNLLTEANLDINQLLPKNNDNQYSKPLTTNKLIFILDNAKTLIPWLALGVPLPKLVNYNIDKLRMMAGSGDILEKHTGIQRTLESTTPTRRL